MLADLERCVGCQTCAAACRHTNATSPAVQWRKVLDIEAGKFPNVSRTFVPVGCQHCADPPCMHVCPSTATRKRADGIVTIDYNICIGCAYCDVACPYQARFKVGAIEHAYGATATQNEMERENPAMIGVAQKCTFCADRIDFGLANGLVPGVDPRATPACVNACIADALKFGDLDDPDGNVARLLETNRHFRMHEELGTEPGFYYLYDHAGDGGAAAAEVTRASPHDPEANRVRTRGVEPWHQQHWDWKAAGNFLTGGVGSGLFAAATLAALMGFPVVPLGLLAALLIAIGLFLVFLKIGRRLRSIFVLRQPGRSWMSREAWVAGGFFPLAMLAILTDEAIWWTLAGVLALAFLYCQARILEQAKAIPTWRASTIVPVIALSGLAEGAGAFLIATATLFELGSLSTVTAVVTGGLVVARDVAWRTHRRGLDIDGALTLALEALDGLRPVSLALGLIVPVVGIVIGLIAPPAAPILYVIAGVAAMVSGLWYKFVLVTRAGYNQGYALRHTPTRGEGAIGPAVKPGWKTQEV